MEQYLDKSIQFFQLFWENLTRLPEAGNVFEAEIFLTVWIPLMCLLMALTGFILIMRRNRWGYALSFVGCLGIALVQFFLN